MSQDGGRRPIVLVHLMGGLGNQMFQYAFGRRMALHNSVQLLLDTSGYRAGVLPDSANGTRTVGLSHFLIKGTLTDDPSGASAARVPIRRWIRKSRAVAARITDQRKPYFLRRQIIEPLENHFRFDPRLLNVRIRNSVSLRGFWQCEAYFLDVGDRIRGELVLRDEPREKNAEMAGRIRATNAVAIHVRHGDNANDVAAGLGVLPREYYVRAISEIRRDVEAPEFFVFSDDIAWSRQMLPGDTALNFIDHNGALLSHEDMRLMTLCKHHILANSTFGWWGAWLAQTPGQIVIAPRRYYVGTDRPNPDLYPPPWRLLQP